MGRPRLLWRLYGTLLLITLGSLLAVGLLGTGLLRSFTLERTTEDLAARARLLQETLGGRLQAKEIDALCEKAGRASSTRLTVMDARGRVLGDSDHDPLKMDDHSTRPEVAEALKGRRGTSTRFSDTLRRNMLYVAVPVREGERVVGVVRTAVPMTSVEETLHALRLALLLAAVLVALVAAGVSWMLSRWISRPLEEMKQGAVRFAAGDLAHRLPVSGTEELAKVAEGMNRMAEQLQERIGRLSRQHSELNALVSSMTGGGGGGGRRGAENRDDQSGRRRALRRGLRRRAGPQPGPGHPQPRAAQAGSEVP